MRSVAAVDVEIAATSRRLNALRVERADVRQAEIDAVVAAFEDGGTPAKIALAFGMTPGSVVGTLHRAGRSKRGRDAVRRQLSGRTTDGKVQHPRAHSGSLGNPPSSAA